MEELAEAGSDEDEGVDMEEEEGAAGEGGRKVYVPGIEPLRPGEQLEMDRSAYRMYHECQTGKTNCISSPNESPQTSSPEHLNGRTTFSVFRCSVSELRRAERRRWRKQGAVPSVHAAVCGHAGGHGDEQQVQTPEL